MEKQLCASARSPFPPVRNRHWEGGKKGTLPKIPTQALNNFKKEMSRKKKPRGGKTQKTILGNRFEGPGCSERGKRLDGEMASE